MMPRPLKNLQKVKFIKVGVTRERAGVAQKYFRISIYLDEYYRFDPSLDFYGVAPIYSPLTKNNIV